jgi:hypothetical protein
MNSFTTDDLNELKTAKLKLEYPGLTARIADAIGKPIEVGLDRLPKVWNKKIGEITRAALFKGLEFALLTMGNTGPKKSQDWLHKALVVGSGIAGGAAGIVSMPLELPVSTTIILRSIADIARSEGHDISMLRVRLSCLEVLALGGRNAEGDSAEVGYWAIRTVLARHVETAAAYIAEKGLADEGAPPLVRLITAIASRFSVVVTEEAAAKLVPIVGAVAGGLINYLFMHHFQEMARGHFIIKRLERKYGAELTRQVYEALMP